MAVKILTADQVFNPVKIEVTFETKEQLQSFVDLYGAASAVSRLVEDNLSRVTSRGINSLIDIETWNNLSILSE